MFGMYGTRNSSNRYATLVAGECPVSSAKTAASMGPGYSNGRSRIIDDGLTQARLATTKAFLAARACSQAALEAFWLSLKGSKGDVNASHGTCYRHKTHNETCSGQSCLNFPISPLDSAVLFFLGIPTPFWSVIRGNMMAVIAMCFSIIAGAVGISFWIGYTWFYQAKEACWTCPGLVDR